MTKKQWQIIYYCQYMLIISVFAFCIMNNWKKTGWFVVLPLGIVTCTILRKKKNPN
jgi:hypothetical protein